MPEENQTAKRYFWKGKRVTEKVYFNRLRLQELASKKFRNPQANGHVNEKKKEEEKDDLKKVQKKNNSGNSRKEILLKKLKADSASKTSEMPAAEKS